MDWLTRSREEARALSPARCTPCTLDREQGQVIQEAVEAVRQGRVKGRTQTGHFRTQTVECRARQVLGKEQEGQRQDTEFKSM